MEQVYDPNYDVYVNPSDGSGSNATPSSVQGLINDVSKSSESERGVSFWSNIVNAFRDIFKNGVKLRTNDEVFNNQSWKGTNPYSDSGSYFKKPATDKQIEKYNEIVGKNNDNFVPLTTHEQDVSSKASSNLGSDVQAWVDYMEKLIRMQYEYNENNAIRAQKFEEEQAQKLRDWQEYMSSTSYQRAIEDLTKAGINPLLAISSLTGASTPSGAMASGFSSSGSLGNASSFYSSLTSQLGQNKALGTNFLNILIRILSLLV